MNLLELVFEFIFQVLKFNIVVSCDDYKTYVYDHGSLLWRKSDKQTAQIISRAVFDKMCENYIFHGGNGKFHKHGTLMKFFDMCYSMAIQLPAYQKHCMNVRSSMNNSHSLPYDKYHCMFQQNTFVKRDHDVKVSWALDRKHVDINEITKEESEKIQQIYDILGDDLIQFLINVLRSKYRKCMVVKTTQAHILFNFIVRLFNCPAACHVFRNRQGFKAALEDCPILVVNETQEVANELMNVHKDYFFRTDELIETAEYMEVVKIKFHTLIITKHFSDFDELYDLEDISELANLCCDNLLDFFLANTLRWCIQDEEDENSHEECNSQNISAHEITHVAVI